MRRAILPLPVLLSALLQLQVTPAVFAQNSQTAYKLQHLRFVGSKRYSQEQLLAASGLKLGSAYSAQDFQNAANALSTSGAFSQVSYRFNGAEAEYQLIDNNEFIPCLFRIWSGLVMKRSRLG